MTDKKGLCALFHAPMPFLVPTPPLPCLHALFLAHMSSSLPQHLLQCPHTLSHALLNLTSFPLPSPLLHILSCASTPFSVITSSPIPSFSLPDPHALSHAYTLFLMPRLLSKAPGSLLQLDVSILQVYNIFNLLKKAGLPATPNGTKRGGGGVRTTLHSQEAST